MRPFARGSFSRCRDPCLTPPSPRPARTSASPMMTGDCAISASKQLRSRARSRLSPLSRPGAGPETAFEEPRRELASSTTRLQSSDRFSGRIAAECGAAEVIDALALKGLCLDHSRDFVPVQLEALELRPDLPWAHSRVALLALSTSSISALDRPAGGSCGAFGSGPRAVPVSSIPPASRPPADPHPSGTHGEETPGGGSAR